jgi:DNA-binding transcriptional ArsR family regulator
VISLWDHDAFLTTWCSRFCIVSKLFYIKVGGYVIGLQIAIDTASLNPAKWRAIRLKCGNEKTKARIKKLASVAGEIDDSEADFLARIFKAMSDPCRLKMLILLEEGEICAFEMMVALGRPQSSTSHHLSILKDAGLIKERKDGKWSKYRLSDGAVIEILNQVGLLKA